VERRPAFAYIAGHVALDFVNTLDWRADPARRREMLVTVDDLLEWAAGAKLVSRAEARTMKAAFRSDPRRGPRIVRRARGLREVLARIFAVRRGGEAAPSPRDLRLFNALLGEALRTRRVEARGGQCVWGWARDEDVALVALLWPIVLAGAELLTSSERAQVGECAGEGCGWLFLDTSRSRRRRWCDMQACGNRAKARRFYQRRAGAC